MIILLYLCAGLSHQYPYSESSCHVYEYLVEASPLHSATLLLLLLYYSHSATTTTPSSSFPSTGRQLAPLPAILAALLTVAIGKEFLLIFYICPVKSQNKKKWVDRSTETKKFTSSEISGLNRVGK